MTKMSNFRDSAESDAAREYADLRAETGSSYAEVFDAFLAGIDWLRRRWTNKPEKEYYGG